MLWFILFSNFLMVVSVISVFSEFFSSMSESALFDMNLVNSFISCFVLLILAVSLSNNFSKLAPSKLKYCFAVFSMVLLMLVLMVRFILLMLLMVRVLIFYAKDKCSTYVKCSFLYFSCCYLFLYFS